MSETAIWSPLKGFTSAKQADDFSLDHGADDFTVYEIERKTAKYPKVSLPCSGAVI